MFAGQSAREDLDQELFDKQSERGCGHVVRLAPGMTDVTVALLSGGHERTPLKSKQY